MTAVIWAKIISTLLRRCCSIPSSQKVIMWRCQLCSPLLYSWPKVASKKRQINLFDSLMKGTMAISSRKRSSRSFKTPLLSPRLLSPFYQSLKPFLKSATLNSKISTVGQSRLPTTYLIINFALLIRPSKIQLLRTMASSTMQLNYASDSKSCGSLWLKQTGLELTLWNKK